MMAIHLYRNIAEHCGTPPPTHWRLTSMQCVADNALVFWATKQFTSI